MYFDGKQSFEVILDNVSRGNTCGFCGNNNGDPTDDLQLGPSCKADGHPFNGPEVSYIMP